MNDLRPPFPRLPSVSHFIFYRGCFLQLGAVSEFPTASSRWEITSTIGNVAVLGKDIPILGFKAEHSTLIVNPKEDEHEPEEADLKGVGPESRRPQGLNCFRSIPLP